MWSQKGEYGTKQTSFFILRKLIESEMLILTFINIEIYESSILTISLILMPISKF